MAGILIFCLWFFNGIYYYTPLEAVAAEREDPLPIGPYSCDELFDIKELLDIVMIEDEARVLFISEAETFNCVSCEYSSMRKNGDIEVSRMKGI